MEFHENSLSSENYHQPLIVISTERRRHREKHMRRIRICVAYKNSYPDFYELVKLFRH